MARLAQFMFICVVCIGALAQNESQPQAVTIDKEHTAWIVSTLHSIQTIKPGMTRSDLTKLFTEQGGLSTMSQSTYVYRQCPFIKINVTFTVSSKEELPTDRITEVSRPYLEWAVFD